MVVAEQKGRDTKQRFYRNFGMPKPEGYRKALRVMQMAGEVPAADHHAVWIRPGHTRESMPRSAGRRRPSRATCGKWRGWRCR